MRSLVTRLSSQQLFWPVLALAALLLVNVIATPTFFEIRLQDGHLYGNLVDILRNGAPVLLVALGMTLVIATRGIDLSVGAVAAISGAVACTWIAGADEGSAGKALVACLLALVVCLVLGLWNGFLVSVLGIQPIIATLVLMTAGRGVAMLITGGEIKTINNPTFSRIGGGFVLTLPLAILIALFVFGLTAALTRRTALGMLVEAVGINPEASRLAGVRARTIIWTAMIASNTNAADANAAGLWIELDAILAVVIGGTSLAGGRFSLAGTLVGALFLTTLAATIPNNGIPTETHNLFKAVVVILVCLLQSPKARAALAVRRRPTSRPTSPTGAQPVQAGAAA